MVSEPETSIDMVVTPNVRMVRLKERKPNLEKGIAHSKGATFWRLETPTFTGES